MLMKAFYRESAFCFFFGFVFKKQKGTSLTAKKKGETPEVVLWKTFNKFPSLYILQVEHFLMLTVLYTFVDLCISFGSSFGERVFLYVIIIMMQRRYIININ